MLVKKKVILTGKGSFYNDYYYRYTFTRMLRESRSLFLIPPISRVRSINSDLKIWIYDLTIVKSLQK